MHADPPILQAARESLAFAELLPQLALFPLRPIVNGGCTCRAGPQCAAIGKHPTAQWSGLNAGEKWSGAPGCGYGIATGSRSGIFVVDLDGLDAVHFFYRMGRDLCNPVPRTFTVRRGDHGHGHLYFKCPEFPVRTSAGIFAAGIDIRGEGGMVVAPGSPHKSGEVYFIADDSPVAAAPPWLLSWPALRKGTDEVGPPPVAIGPDSPEWSDRVVEAVEYLRTAKPAVSGQRGHTTLWNVAQCLMRSIELPIETAHRLLVQYYNPRCQPPWSEKELRYKLEQARDRGHFELRSEIDRFNAEIIRISKGD